MEMILLILVGFVCGYFLVKLILWVLGLMYALFILTGMVVLMGLSWTVLQVSSFAQRVIGR